MTGKYCTRIDYEDRWKTFGVHQGRQESLLKWKLFLKKDKAGIKKTKKWKSFPRVKTNSEKRREERMLGDSLPIFGPKYIVVTKK